MKTQVLHNESQLLDMYRSLYQLNETGEILTQQLDSEQTSQTVVDKIRDTTKADLVVLYPYNSTRQCFVLPPRIAGTLEDPTTKESMSPNRPGGTATQILHRAKPIFAQQGSSINADPNDSTYIRQSSFGRREQIRSMAAMPLRIGEEVVGVLFINFRQTQCFDDIQKLFIEGLAHYTAIAIKNAQLFSNLNQRRVHELEILQNIDRELNRTLELASLLNTILKLACEQVPADEVSILLYNPKIQALEIPAAIGPHAESRQMRIIPLYETRYITHWVLEHKKPARVGNVHRDPNWRDLYIEAAADTVSELDVPLLDGEEVVGVLNFESTKENAFSQQDEDFLITLAGQAVLAIKNAQAYEREKRLAEEGRVLNQISKDITRHLNHTHVFNLILEKALELTHSTLGSLNLYNPELNDLQMVAECGVSEEKKGQRQSLDQGIMGYVAARKQLQNVGDVTQDTWKSIYMEYSPGVRSELSVPMLAGDELRGVLNVESPVPNHFTEHDERLMQELADLAVVALQNAERYEQARREAQRFALWYRAEQELDKITDPAQLEQAYDVILRIAEEHSQTQVFIRRYDPDTHDLVLIRSSESQSPFFLRQNLDVGINGQVARERRTLVILDTRNPPTGIAPVHLADPAIRSLLITPIMFKDQYYGNLGLRHNDVGYFWGADITFFEGLAQQLATTIDRLETAQERQEFEQRISSLEIMSSIGQVSFELTHRWGNDLGLVAAYVDDIRLELEEEAVSNITVAKKLDNIVRVTRKVLDLNRGLKQALSTSGEPVVISPVVLLEETQAQALPSLPPDIQIELAIDEDVASIEVIYSQVADILRNLVTNATEAMPEGGTITLGACNVGRFVTLEVTDTGIGISPQQQSKIFDLSFSTKGSSGFGLWSARTNALKNHGDLKVKSELGQGTTFTLYLPRVEKGRS